MERGTERDQQLPRAHPAQGSHPVTQSRTLPPGEVHPGGHSPEPVWFWVVTPGEAGGDGQKGVALWVAWGKGAWGQPGVMEPKPSVAFGSPRTKGSLGTQALDPVTVTQRAEGHFTPFSAFFGWQRPRATFTKHEIKVERVKEEGSRDPAMSVWSITSPTKGPGELWGLYRLSPGTARCNDGCFSLLLSAAYLASEGDARVGMGSTHSPESSFLEEWGPGTTRGLHHQFPRLPMGLTAQKLPSSPQGQPTLARQRTFSDASWGA